MADLIEADRQEMQKQEPTPRVRRKTRGEVIIFGMWCKGCGLCVEFCPAGVLALNENDQPEVVKPENCTACQWCETHCPDLAIIVKRIEDSGGNLGS